MSLSLSMYLNVATRKCPISFMGRGGGFANQMKGGAD